MAKFPKIGTRTLEHQMQQFSQATSQACDKMTEEWNADEDCPLFIADNIQSNYPDEIIHIDVCMANPALKKIELDAISKAYIDEARRVNELRLTAMDAYAEIINRNSREEKKCDIILVKENVYLQMMKDLDEAVLERVSSGVVGRLYGVDLMIYTDENLEQQLYDYHKDFARWSGRQPNLLKVN